MLKTVQILKNNYRSISYSSDVTLYSEKFTDHELYQSYSNYISKKIFRKIVLKKIVSQFKRRSYVLKIFLCFKKVFTFKPSSSKDQRFGNSSSGQEPFLFRSISIFEIRKKKQNNKFSWELMSFLCIFLVPLTIEIITDFLISRNTLVIKQHQ